MNGGIVILSICDCFEWSVKNRRVEFLMYCHASKFRGFQHMYRNAPLFKCQTAKIVLYIFGIPREARDKALKVVLFDVIKF